MKEVIRSQKGVGLMEVLVSLFILSIAILGFVALQVRATVATEESIKRSDALIILNGLAEKMRLNPSAVSTYKESAPSSQPSCVANKNCNAANQARADLYMYTENAKAKNIYLQVVDCPNTSNLQNRACIIAAWNDTEPEQATDTSTTKSCLTSTGKYADKADCLILEAY
ncbi:type IV pilus modification protein PilV [Acinetobacter sp. A2]|uniref:type IV pilus modification protein PilV n=1 Tax=Acinetobacter sp. A2 TaxID=362457 RepID=UPI003AF3DBB9